MDGSEDAQLTEKNRAYPKVVAPKGFRIERADVKAYGPSIGCGGCRNAISGFGSVNHTPKCRKRFMDMYRESRDPRAVPLEESEKFHGLEPDKDAMDDLITCTPLRLDIGKGSYF